MMLWCRFAIRRKKQIIFFWMACHKQSAINKSTKLISKNIIQKPVSPSNHWMAKFESVGEAVVEYCTVQYWFYSSANYTLTTFCQCNNIIMVAAAAAADTADTTEAIDWRPNLERTMMMNVILVSQEERRNKSWRTKLYSMMSVCHYQDLIWTKKTWITWAKEPMLRYRISNNRPDCQDGWMEVDNVDCM